VTAPRVRQLIPRPPWTYRVEPPVDGLEVVDAASGLSMGAVRGAFGAAPARTGVTPEPGAAVLITLVPDDEGPEGRPAPPGSPASVVLIRRATSLRANPGEIAFPGGRIETGEDPLAAALREAEEEVALRAADVDVLDRLPMLERSSGLGPVILPFVAAAPRRPALTPNPEEVESVLIVPLAELVAPGRYWQERWDAAGAPDRTMHFFDLGEDVIWGATARMLYLFLLRLLGGAEGSSVGPDGEH
jgi:8-oxo-dGTP pyrophosphatase MutT (NUDIX family)